MISPHRQRSRTNATDRKATNKIQGRRGKKYVLLDALDKSFRMVELDNGGDRFPWRGTLPATPISARLFSRYARFYDAVGQWRTLKTLPLDYTRPVSEGVWPENVEKRIRLENEEAIRRRREADQLKADPARRIQDALGASRHDYRAAEQTLRAWCDEAARQAGMTLSELCPPGGRHIETFPALTIGPRSQTPGQLVARELMEQILPLLQAYAEPENFFRNILPTISGFFVPAYRPHHLGITLHMWGVAALWNPDVLDAFLAAGEDPRAARLLLAEAEARGVYKEGAPPRARQRKSANPIRARVEVERDIREQIDSPAVDKEEATREWMMSALECDLSLSTVARSWTRERSAATLARMKLWLGENPQFAGDLEALQRGARAWAARENAFERRPSQEKVPITSR